jgi:predicted small lipoprotein YifL
MSERRIWFAGGPMRRRINASISLALALALSACGLAEYRSPLPLPDFMRAKPSDPPPPEPPPDIRQLVRDRLDSVFVTQANPQRVQVSQPRHELRGLGWTACVKAELTSANGKPLGEETYRITINNGVVIDRRRAETADACASETYQPI